MKYAYVFACWFGGGLAIGAAVVAMAYLRPPVAEFFAWIDPDYGSSFAFAFGLIVVAGAILGLFAVLYERLMPAPAPVPADEPPLDRPRTMASAEVHDIDLSRRGPPRPTPPKGGSGVKLPPVAKYRQPQP